MRDFNFNNVFTIYVLSWVCVCVLSAFPNVDNFVRLGSSGNPNPTVKAKLRSKIALLIAKHWCFCLCMYMHVSEAYGKSVRFGWTQSSIYIIHMHIIYISYRIVSTNSLELEVYFVAFDLLPHTIFFSYFSLFARCFCCCIFNFCQFHIFILMTSIRLSDVVAILLLVMYFSMFYRFVFILIGCGYVFVAKAI